MARFRTRPGHSVGNEIVLDDRGPIGSIRQGTRKGRRSDVWAWSLYPSASSPRQFSGEARTRAEALNAIERAYTKREKEAPARFVGEAPRRGVPADETSARELVMYIENESDLSPDGPSGQGRDVLLNALRKYRKGTYNPALAVKLFGYLVESGAKRYAREFGSSEREWSTMFPPATRQEAARQLEASFRSSAEQGEYDRVDTKRGAREPQGAREPGRRMRSRRRGVTPHVGARVEAGVDDGYDTGVVFAIRGDQADVGWDSGVRTWIEIRRLHVISSGPDAGRVRAPRDRDRPISMTYGQLPGFAEFERDIRRPDPENRNGGPYWPPGTLYPMELVDRNEIGLAEDFGGLDEFTPARHTHKRGFQGDERQIYDFLNYLAEEFAREANEGAGDLASSIMTTLGYEWI